jgi:tRNA nucleotidyltransferase (CCA-adding enzyme)
MDDFEKVLEEARNNLVRNDTEKVRPLVENLIEQIKQRAKEKGLEVEIMLTGSYARGTWVLGESDVDIYVIFKNEEETKRLKELVPDNFEVERGTREYFVGYINGIKFEIVPVVKISSPEEAKNSIDLSIFHTPYVLSRLNEKLSKDIALLKMFLKSIHVYGAESYRRGFSGYLTEVLVLYFNGIENLFRDVLNWKPQIVISSEKLMKEFTEPLVVIDPTNKNRNLAAALSLENLAKFVFAVKKFIAYPSLDYFRSQSEEEEIKERANKRKSAIMEFNLTPRPPKEVYFSKLRHGLEVLQEELRKQRYNVNLFLIPDSNKIIAEIIPYNIVQIQGPSVFIDTKNVIAFASKHDVYVKGEYLFYDIIMPDLKTTEDTIRAKIDNLLKEI